MPLVPASGWGAASVYGRPHAEAGVAGNGHRRVTAPSVLPSLLHYHPTPACRQGRWKGTAHSPRWHAVTPPMPATPCATHIAVANCHRPTGTVFDRPSTAAASALPLCRSG